MYDSCVGDFGTPDFLSSFQPCTSRGDVICNSIYLPPPGSDLEAYFWKYDNGSESKCEPAKEVDLRYEVIACMKSIGDTLEYCKSVWDLCECLLHSMLGVSFTIFVMIYISNNRAGWLSVYQSGYLQRDVSVGNVLRLTSPVKMMPFSIKKLIDFRDAVSNKNHVAKRKDVQDKKDMLQELKVNHNDLFLKGIDEVVEDAQSLYGKLEQLGLSMTCKAVILDGDLSAYIPTYFRHEHEQGQLSVSACWRRFHIAYLTQRQGTIEFMSPGLLQAAKAREAYLHKPVDDIYSFYWLALYITVLHPKAVGSTNREEVWRNDLCHDHCTDVTGAFKRLYGAHEVADCSSLVKGMFQLLKDWGPAIDRLEEDMQADLRSDDPIVSNRLLCFDRFAYRSINVFVDLLIKHCKMFTEEPFEQPKP